MEGGAMRRLSIEICAVGLLGVIVLRGAGPISACMLDQKPSMSVNGRLAHATTQVPKTQAELAVWTYFVFSGRYAANQPIVLGENKAEVAHTLSAEAMKQPVIWSFGDGQGASGWTVRHTYGRAGRWQVKIAVWDPYSGRWDLFDQATVTTG
jgi:hypothetical protein